MIYLCQPNRVRRTYLGGSRIDSLRRSCQSDGFSRDACLCVSSAHNHSKCDNSAHSDSPRDVPSRNSYYPEEWVASLTPAYSADSTNPEGLSRISDGRTLRELIESDPALIGTGSVSDIGRMYPILLKLLDADERLVIQAHPTAEFARKHMSSEFGKAECWYVVSADPGAHIYLGFREGITRNDWVRAFETQDSEYMLSLLHRIELCEGDVWYVDGGVPHAIGGGCLLAELQEPSDLMVVMERVTPSGRVIPDRRIDCGLGSRMFDVYDYTGYSETELRRRYFRHPEPRKNEFVTLVGADLTDKFRLYCCEVNEGICRHVQNKPSAAAVIAGQGKISSADCELEISSGDCLFLPANAGELIFSGSIRVILAEGGF